MTRVPRYIAERIRRTIPAGGSVVEGSTPVISFGNAEVAWVATLGLNPSRREFADAKGNLLDGVSRRLATLESLRLRTLENASEEQVDQVLRDCHNYFDRNPYWGWFKPLETLLNAASGASYQDRTACHLDLVQWATDPVWSHLTAPVRQRLIEQDQEFLREQLQREQIRLVLLNGRTVIEQTQQMGIVLEERPAVAAHGNTSKIFVGEEYGATFIGWSKNLQSAFGMSTPFMKSIAERVRNEATAAGAAQLRAAGDQVDHLERGTTVRSKSELAGVLASWLDRSSAQTIGDVGRYGGKAWVIAELDDHKIVLNADTKREAVEAFVRHAKRHGAESPWPVIANTKGKVNKVVYTSQADLPGWYCYLSKPWTETGAL